MFSWHVSSLTHWSKQRHCKYDPVTQIWLCGSKHDTPIKSGAKMPSPSPWHILCRKHISALFSLFSISTSYSSSSFPLQLPLLRTHSRSKDIRGFCFLLHHLKELSISVCPSHWLKATVKLRGRVRRKSTHFTSGASIESDFEYFLKFTFPLGIRCFLFQLFRIHYQQNIRCHHCTLVCMPP